MMLIGSLITVKGSILVSRLPEAEVFSGKAAERLASENEAAPSSVQNTIEAEDKSELNAPPFLPSIPENGICANQSGSPDTVNPSAETPAEDSFPQTPAATPADASQTSAETSEPIDFSSTLFIGDSRTEGLKEYGGLTEAEFFANSGMSSFNLLSARLTVKDKSRLSLEELLSGHSYERIYLMLGINELGYSPSAVTKQYSSVVDRIRQLQPQARIILEANLHVTKKKSDSDPVYGNGKIDALNLAIYQMAVEKGCGYVDVNSLFDDGQGNLDSKYSVDNAHIMGKYYTVWAQWLRTQNV